jgi:UPF0755 protein
MNKKLFILINLLILAGFIGASYFFFVLRPVAESANSKKFVVSSGQGLREITAALKEANLIRSKKAAEIFALIFGLAHRLKPGNYFLDSSQGTPKILNILANGPQDVTVIINEGMSLRDADAALSAKGILPKGTLVNLSFDDLKKDYEFLKTAKGLEGYLFPDTYRFFPESDPALVVRKFLDNFNNKAWPLIKGCQTSSIKCHDLTANEVLILASLIEKEVSNSEDRKLVAGVLLKRLDLGMALQVDATLSYIKCGGSFFFCENPAVERKDLALASLYNTYRYPGLPPAPISNPGKDAIEAVLNAQPESYLYYLSDPKTKKTIFSKTLEEHNENRARYLGL